VLQIAVLIGALIAPILAWIVVLIAVQIEALIAFVIEVPIELLIEVIAVSMSASGNGAAALPAQTRKRDGELEADHGVADETMGRGSRGTATSGNLTRPSTHGPPQLGAAADTPICRETLGKATRGARDRSLGTGQQSGSARCHGSNGMRLVAHHLWPSGSLWPRTTWTC
jgi:hypothetical protein